MGDTVITMDDGGRFYPSSSTDSVQCSSCDNVVDTPSEVASYPDGDCPQCGNAWTKEAKRHTSITVSMPEAINGGTG